MSESPLVLVNDYLPEEYHLDLQISSIKPNFQGYLKFPLKRARNDFDQFKLVLHGHKLIILEALVGGVKLDVKYDKPAQKIELSTSQPISQFDVTIKYVGSIQSLDTIQQTRGVFRSPGDKVIISTQSQPIFARQILPLIDESNFKIPFKLTITTEKHFKVIANMGLEAESVNGDEKTSVFKKSPPILPSTIGFTIGELEGKIIQSSIPIGVYGTKEDMESVNIPYIMSILEKVFPLIQSKLGAYPLDKLDIIGVPYLTEGAMENWGMITVVKDHLFKGHELHIKQLLSHELIHQWLGNLVSFDNWKYLWLNESMATLLGNYFVSVLDGNDEAFKLDLMTINERLCNDDHHSIEKFMNSLVINNDITTSYLFNHQVYEKGIIILRMLVNVISDKVDDFDKFFEFLKDFVEFYKFKSIKPQDLWTFIYKDLSVDLLTFVNIWIRYDKFPTLQITINDNQLTIEQMQSKVYHFPLILKTSNGSKKVYIMNKVTKVEISDLLVINQDKITLFKGDISKKIIKTIDISQLNKLDTNVYLIDYKAGDFNKKLQQHVNNL
ncbi:hypothetical protein CLIB1444_03S03642 [[Candida] jaroonii]|uniref:Uncharacterized protein n=1 Tax=[Candida] jaroonii TaxID=467808 RepID=A0ACA9Y503_9ASCO|nr:hypothetical protein CLIB1444_03S03642 [[Candida] jaroonii]